MSTTIVAGRRSPASGATRSAASGAAAGFTLLEVILALVIFSMLTAMVYSAFAVGHDAVMKGERETELNQRMRVADDLLARQLRSTVFYFARQDDESFPFFIGRSEWMSFVSASPQARGGNGLAVITYRVVDGTLILEERVAFTPADLYSLAADPRGPRAVVLTGASSIRFEYLPQDEPNMTWQRDWDARDEDTLPAAVRITVEGLDFFASRPWVRDVPVMTINYGWGNEDYQEPPDEEEIDEEDEEVSENEADEAEGEQ
jgi:general secretion pathway protein J